jgi:alpha-amylase/alpha-mannosidase (GH57 family)
MHQPWYVDPGSGKILLPWVRLHAASAYRDMASLLEQHAGVRATVNLSPSLLDQIHRYLAGAEDTYEAITLRPASELSTEERAFLLRHFFSVHWGSVLEGVPSYRRLLEKRGREMPAGGDAAAAATFSVEEMRDLQVLFNLTWLGFTAAQDPAIRALYARGGGFTEEDKRVVLDRQRCVLGEVLPAWKELVGRGVVELMASPYYHPILPLLVDTNVARRATPEARLPERFCFPGDAETQVSRAIERVEREFGVRPAGLWPSEGAVSVEAVQLAQKCGVRYLVTDAEILYRSLDDRGSTPGRRRLYQPYRMGECAVFFRDATLSDAIAKEYCSWADPGSAAADFLARVRRVAEVARLDGNAPPIVVIALDGENPWEAYPKRGHDFLSALYTGLAASPDIRTVTLGEHLRDHPPVVSIEHLHSGSWIEANYAIWIGDPDKNRAWNLLSRARKRLARAETTEEVTGGTLEAAREHILRAEGSDWFWWLGEPFSSAEEVVYENLFRGHIMAMYRLLGDSPPADLSRPIEEGAIVQTLRQPSAYIQPRIDGKRTSFFEWRGAGFHRVPAAGSMYQTHSFITGLYWGFDAARFFLRLDPTEDLREGATHPLQDLDIWFELSHPGRSLICRLMLTTPPELRLSAVQGGKATELGSLTEVAYVEVVELAIPLARLGLHPGIRIGLSAHFAREGEILSRVPDQGVIEVEVPAEEFES